MQGFDRDSVAWLLLAARNLTRAGQPVTAATLAASGQYDVDEVGELLEDPGFVQLASSQGITIGSRSGLSARQLAALAIYMDTSVRANHAKRLALAGVSAAEWSTWMLDHRFSAQLAQFSEDRLREVQPVALQRLAEHVDKGDRWAIELGLEMSGRWDRRAQNVNLPALFTAILTVLDEEIAPLPGGESVVLRIAERLRTVTDVTAGRPPTVQQAVEASR